MGKMALRICISASKNYTRRRRSSFSNNKFYRWRILLGEDALASPNN